MSDPKPDGECDCCGIIAPVTLCLVSGVETYACAECMGLDPEDDEEEDDQ